MTENERRAFLSRLRNVDRKVEGYVYVPTTTEEKVQLLIGIVEDLVDEIPISDEQ